MAQKGKTQMQDLIYFIYYALTLSHSTPSPTLLARDRLDGNALLPIKPSLKDRTFNSVLHSQITSLLSPTSTWTLA